MIPRRFKRSPSKVLVDAAYLSGGTITTFLVSIAGMILIPRFLETTVFGIWKTYQVVLQYTGQSHLGLVNAMVRVGPAMAVAKDRRPFHRMMGSVLWAMVVIGLVEVAVIVYLAVSRWEEPLFRYSLLLLAALVFLQQLHLFYDFAATVTRQFKLKSLVLAASSTGRTVLMIATAWAFGLEAMLVAYAVTVLAGVLVLARRTAIRIPRGFGFGELPGLFKVGIPMTAVVLVELLVQTTDKLITVSVLGFEQMGYYGLATMVFPLLLMLPQSIRQILAIEVFRTAELPEERPQATRLVRRTVMLLALAAPLMGGALFLGAEWGMRLILPRYLPGLDSLLILSFGVAPIAWTQCCMSTLVVFRQEFRVTAFGVIIAGMNVVASLTLLTHLESPLVAIALSHSAGFLLFGLVIVLWTEVLMARGEGRACRVPALAGLAFRCAGPLVYAAGAALLTDWLLPVYTEQSVSHLAGLGNVVLRLLLFGLLAAPLLWPLYHLARTSSLGRRG